MRYSTHPLATRPPLNTLPYGNAAPTLAGPAAHLGPRIALIGRIHAGPDLWLGTNAVIRADGHHVHAGARLQLGRGSTVHIAHDLYPTLIGDDVTVGANAVVHACEIGDGCVLDDGAVVLDACVLEPGCVLAPGSVVFPRTRLTGGQLYGGKPAKPLRALAAGELDALRASLRARNAAAARVDAALADGTGTDERQPVPADATPAAGPVPPSSQAAPLDAPSAAFIANTATLRGRVVLAPHANVWYGCLLDAAGGAIAVGLRSNVQDNSVLACSPHGRITLGIDTTIGHNVTMADSTVGDRCLIGIGAVVAPGTVVQDDVFLAAGAVTLPGQVLEAGHLWVGAPARRLAPLDDAKRALIADTIPTYCGYADVLAVAQREAAVR